VKGDNAMKALGVSLFATIALFFLSVFIVAPIMSNIGYSSVESSYHLQTHALLVTLIFTVILCTILGARYVVEEIKKEKE
jgi:predicted ABC-type exoprotein transport system permease subunit